MRETYYFLMSSAGKFENENSIPHVIADFKNVCIIFIYETFCSW